MGRLHKHRGLFEGQWALNSSSFCSVAVGPCRIDCSPPPVRVGYNMLKLLRNCTENSRIVRPGLHYCTVRNL